MKVSVRHNKTSIGFQAFPVPEPGETTPTIGAFLWMGFEGAKIFFCQRPQDKADRWSPMEASGFQDAPLAT